MGFARNVEVIAFYEGIDISEAIQNSISRLTYTDNSRDMIDDLTLELENFDNRWLGSWFPDENARLLVGIIQNENGKKKCLDLGTFYVDEPTFSPNFMDLKCIAVPLDQTLIEQKNSSAWEKVTLYKLIKQIADKHEMDANFYCEDSFIERVDQDKETDLEFLKRITEELALNLKITNDSIVVFDDAYLESAPVVTTFSIEDQRLRDYSLKLKNYHSYDECEVTYYDADKKRTVSESVKKSDVMHK